MTDPKYDTLASLTPLQRISKLARAGYLFYLIVALFSVTVSIVAYFNQAIEANKAIERSQMAEERRQTVLFKTNDALKRAQDHLDQARQILKTTPINREDALAEIGLASENLFQLSGAIDYLGRPDVRERRSSLSPQEWLIGRAHAETVDGRGLPNEARRWVLGLVLGVLALTFLVSIVSIFFTSNAEVLKFAFDTVKTLLGFFIGVATTLIGAA
ncbi:hypothetical protein SAMN05216374_2320 [Tardiphaga sp. OK246]|uniref:hypothetical protein n=1 Tax=Tardiphaga sp. OK246 TaxID=1855307 RepID=UPI000B6760FD|nr:hypothetical protein [Tardiphaga sp. OK246]SNT01732.1 hypothetical protein SAMN05216374_2320 [Tardiphaga sp. OK246]